MYGRVQLLKPKKGYSYTIRTEMRHNVEQVYDFNTAVFKTVLLAFDDASWSRRLV